MYCRTERSVEMRGRVFSVLWTLRKHLTLKHEELDRKDTRLVSNLYWNQKAAIRIDNEVTGWIETKCGVRQGCLLSPDLFSSYSQVVMNALEDISIGGRNINNIRYVDDTVLIADSEKKLQSLMNKLNDECDSRGLRINVDKTNTLTVSKRK